jgi:hypothetical protein
MKSTSTKGNDAFMDAYGLLVMPDMSDVDAGRCKAPYINHNKIDFKRLAQLLSDEFMVGSGHELRVAGDTIDQVTLAARAGRLRGHVDKRDPACSDFGEAMLKLAKASKGVVIDVRDEWEELHFMKQRYTEAPPPMIVAFVVSSPDFHEAMRWCANANSMLGRDLFSEFMDDDDDGDLTVGEEGKLPTSLKAELERIFRWPFESGATLMRIASDIPPR